jgi:sarcosine oxidase subunit alpha
MSRRLYPPPDAVAIVHDGDVLPARAGESLAHALLAADRGTLARSPKLHRPRGPYCLRTQCDGCLVRVNGVANVMACRLRVQGGERVETQNVLGTRELDLLAATDFLFPHGLDPHRLFAGVRGVSEVVQRLARRIAGLGRLPDAVLEPAAAERRDVDVVVVGGGAAGLAVAAQLGTRCLLIDDALELGGALRLLEPQRAAKAVGSVHQAGAQIWSESTVCGIYRDEASRGAPGLLVVTPKGAHWLRARAVVLATGTHEGQPDFAGNDLPGVFSARAGLMLVQGGVLPDDRVVLVGRGPFSERARAALEGHVVEHVEDAATVKRLVGVQRVRAVELEVLGKKRSVRAGAVLCEALGTAAFELAAQAGAALEFQNERGYVPRTDPSGLAAPGVWCVGSLVGTPTMAPRARAVALAVLAALGR